MQHRQGKVDEVARPRSLSARFMHNFATNDARAHDRITHREFSVITAQGKRDAKSAYTDHWAHGFDPEVIVYWDYRDEHITLFGDVALVRSTHKHVIVQAGREVTGITTYADTLSQAIRRLDLHPGPVDPGVAGALPVRPDDREAARERATSGLTVAEPGQSRMNEGRGAGQLADASGNPR